MITLIPLFPLIGFLINGVWHILGYSFKDKKTKTSTQKIPGIIATLALFFSFALSLYLFIQLHQIEPEHRFIVEQLFSWISVNSLQVDIALHFDSLSTLFCLVITGVGTLIHLYSIGYMHEEKNSKKFFSYLNLFCFAMLILVLASSLPLVFFGWEGVGLCSYLLIGYEYQDSEKAKAGKKAFIVNRIGDLGFLLGLFFISTVFGTVDLQTLKEITLHTDLWQPHMWKAVTPICLLLFVGCMGKSAQFPLYVWLPDAMAGPTPVSALIHAATMVTSGIYLLSRLNFFYALSPLALDVIARVGLFTAFFAATIAAAQKDIKKILAYSTVSQLGYLFLACGMGAFTAAVFHVITHAFFKALLFLSAGNVIHAMQGEQNIFKMGGLRKQMPKTTFVFAIGCLAICGVPPFSGFFSKDEILWQSYHATQGSLFLWSLALLTALLTAFYMTRLFYLTFLGTPQYKGIHPHESPSSMLLPLQILAVLSTFGGIIGIPHFSWIENWLHPLMAHMTQTEGNLRIEVLLMFVSSAIAALGIGVAFQFYKNKNNQKNETLPFKGLKKFLFNKAYVDEFFEMTLIQPMLKISTFLWKNVDEGGIDRIVLGLAKTSQKTGSALRLLQTGSTQFYAFMLVMGLLVATGYFVYVWN